MSRRDDVEAKVYVGDLARDITEKDLERAFSYYGHLKKVWVARNPPGFAFIEFEDYRDADDAVRGLDGTTLCGSRVRVEHSTGKVRPKPWGRGGPPRSRRMDDDKCYECGERGHFARECTRRGGGGGGGGGGGYGGGRGGGGGGGRGRSYSRSRSPSYDRTGAKGKRSYSRSRSRDRSYSRSPRR